jgi:hypothetical protein
MRSISSSIFVAAVLSIAGLSASSALAQSRVFLAAQGSDSNPCTFALPCRTFQHAHDTVAAGGEINVLDPAGYGAVTITKAIGILGHGFAGISVVAGIAITINAPSNAAVALNGLVIEGNGSGSVGILFNTGKSLVVESCIVRNSTSDGLAFNASSTTLQTLAVTDSSFTGNGGNGMTIATASSGDVTAVVARVGLFNNALAGLQAFGANGTGEINVAVTDSVAGNNNGAVLSPGFLAQAGGPSVALALTRITSAGNGTGVSAFGSGATVKLTQSTVVANTIGFSADNGGIIFSFGDNTMDTKGSVGSLTSAPKQ